MSQQIVFAQNLNEKDYFNYINSGYRIGLWLLSAVTKQTEQLMKLKEENSKNEVSIFNEFKNSVVVGIKNRVPRNELKVLGLKKGLPNSLVRDLIFTLSVEEELPDINKSKKYCENPNSKLCIDIVKKINIKFNLNKKASL
jgi:hypothetical protein